MFENISPIEGYFKCINYVYVYTQCVTVAINSKLPLIAMNSYWLQSCFYFKCCMKLFLQISFHLKQSIIWMCIGTYYVYVYNIRHVYNMHV